MTMWARMILCSREKVFKKKENRRYCRLNTPVTTYLQKPLRGRLRFIFKSASSRLYTELPSEIRQIKSKPQINVFLLYVERKSSRPCWICGKASRWFSQTVRRCLPQVGRGFPRVFQTENRGQLRRYKTVFDRSRESGHDTYVQGILSSLGLWSTVKADKPHRLGRQEDRTKERNMV